MTIWEVFKKERERQGLTVDQLAAKAGVSFSYLRSIEKGEVKNVSMKITFKIAKGLGLKIYIGKDKDNDGNRPDSGEPSDGDNGAHQNGQNADVRKAVF